MTDNLFGAQTTNVLQKFTRVLGGLFFGLTLILSVLYAKQARTSSKTDIEKQLSSVPVPVTPPTPLTPTHPVPSASPFSLESAVPLASATPTASSSAAPEASAAPQPNASAKPSATDSTKKDDKKQ